ncbi:MAG: Rnf-Nqr domain containing protein [Spirochaetales bacterium]
MGEIARGIGRENPVFMTALGLCPSLAVTAYFSSALALSLILIVVLLATAVSISLLNAVVPKQLQLVVGVAILATFVTIADVLVTVHIPPLAEQLGIYLPLLAINGVILNQAHHVAWRHSVGRSVLDALGRGVGFLIGLSLIAIVRELLGSGTLTIWLWSEATVGLVVPALSSHRVLIFATSAGAFMVVAYIKAIMNHRAAKRAERARQEIST